MAKLPSFEDLIPEDENESSSLPTLEELQPEETTPTGTPWSDVPQNALQDVASMGKNIYELGKSGSNMMINAATGNVPALAKQAKNATEAMINLPGNLIETGKEYITEPVESFKQHPVQMATDVASLALPALKGARVADIGADVAGMAGKAARKIAPAVEKLGADARIGSMGITPADIGTRASDLESMNRSTKLLQAEGATPKVMEGATTSLERLEQFSKSPGQLVRRIPEYLDTYGSKPQMTSEKLSTLLESNLLPEPEILIKKKAPYVPQEVLQNKDYLKSVVKPDPQLSDTVTGRYGGAYKQEAAIAREIADTARSHGNSFKDLLDLKQKLQDTAYGSRSATTENATLKAQMYQDATRIVDDIIENEIKDAAPELAPQWMEANQKYSAFKDVEPAMVRGQNKAAAQGVTKFTDFDITRPLATFKKGINTVVASMTDKLTQLAESNPQRLGKFAQSIQNAISKGPQALAAVNYVLQQRDPEYAEMLKQLNEEKPNEE